MAKHDNQHEETGPEFHLRLQRQLDREAWEGRDDIGDKFPERAVVHEIEPFGDGREHIYRTRGK